MSDPKRCPECGQLGCMSLCSRWTEKSASVTAPVEWPAERLRALDRAVAEARGWTLVGPRYWEDPWGGPWSEDNLPAVSIGCRETFELMEEEQIDAGWTISNKACAWVPSKRLGGFLAPTPAIAICLAYLAAKGKEFKG